MAEMTMNEIETELVELRELKAELAPMLDMIARREKKIKDALLELGEKPEVDGVKVTFKSGRSGYTRSTWNNKLLRGYAVAHPEILAFVKETEVSPVAPSVALSFG